MLEDAERHLSEFIDCLMQSSRPSGFLLGAGCACAVKDSLGSPLIPDIAGLTDSVATALKSGSCGDDWSTLAATCAEDGEVNPTIEQMLDRIRGLRSYAGSATVRGLTRAKLEELEQAICLHIVKAAMVDLPDSATPYRSLALWTKANCRADAVEIFTTNYDLLIEQGLEAAQVPIFDGFVGSKRPFFDVESVSNDTLPVRWTRLWKIHGSVNWRRDKDRKEIYRSDKGESAVIHPSHLKYDESRKLPYLALIDRLRNFLRHGQPILVCSGYSFRDQHINEVIIDALGANPAAIVFGLLFGPIENYADAQSLATRATNLRLYASDSCVIGGRRSEWQPKKTKPDDKLPAGVIDWIQPGGPTSEWHPRLNLGDFARLGDILYYVSKGRHHQEPGLASSA